MTRIVGCLSTCVHFSHRCCADSNSFARTGAALVNAEFSVFLECRSLENSCLRASQLKAVTGSSVNQRKWSSSPLPNPTKRQVLINALASSDVANLIVLSKPEVVQKRRCRARTSTAATDWRRARIEIAVPTRDSCVQLETVSGRRTMAV
jgi:hypothetical protein